MPGSQREPTLRTAPLLRPPNGRCWRRHTRGFSPGRARGAGPCQVAVELLPPRPWTPGREPFARRRAFCRAGLDRDVNATQNIRDAELAELAAGACLWRGRETRAETRAWTPAKREEIGPGAATGPRERWGWGATRDARHATGSDRRLRHPGRCLGLDAPLGCSRPDQSRRPPRARTRKVHPPSTSQAQQAQSSQRAPLDRSGASLSPGRASTGWHLQTWPGRRGPRRWPRDCCAAGTAASPGSSSPAAWRGPEA